MTGLIYDRWQEEAMTNVVKKAINSAGGRKQLSDKMGIDYNIIADIADRRDYRLTPATFEHRFGVKLENPYLKQQQNSKKENTYRDVDVEIRCPGYAEMVTLMERMGKKVRIVYDVG
jgi:hypothetical protein